MTAVSTRPIGKREDGKQMVEAVIIADETPAELPIIILLRERVIEAISPFPLSRL